MEFYGNCLQHQFRLSHFSFSCCLLFLGSGGWVVVSVVLCVGVVGVRGFVGVVSCGAGRGGGVAVGVGGVGVCGVCGCGGVFVVLWVCVWGGGRVGVCWGGGWFWDSTDHISHHFFPKNQASQGREGSSDLARTEGFRSHLVSWNFVGKAPSHRPKRVG